MDALSSVSEVLADGQIAWLVVGSVASAIRGCRFEPSDLDLLVPDYRSLEQLSSRLGRQPSSEGALSIQTQEFPGGFKWHKCFWKQNGFPIDISFIECGGGIPDAENGAGVWEGGKLIWRYVEHVEFRGHTVPVPPLCVQLESQLRRGTTDRANEIRRVMHTQGFDRALAERCMSVQNYKYVS